MGHPDYVYTPCSPEHRHKLRLANLKRRGIPPGHHKLYDILVPDELYPELKRIIQEVRRKTDIETAQMMLRTLPDDPDFRKSLCGV